MDFESLKEQVIERLSTYKDRVQDSELYIRGKERYDNFSPAVQQIIKYGLIFFVVYFFYSIPASFVSSANEKLAFFEENRHLTRELIRAGRIEKTVNLPPLAPSPTQLVSEVNKALDQERVLPEQKAATDPLNQVASKSIVPKSIQQSGVKASVKKLNLRQLVRIGESLNSINGSQLMNIKIQADQEDPHYFNVDYEVAAFSVPQSAKPAGGKDEKGKKASKAKRKPRKGNQ